MHGDDILDASKKLMSRSEQVADATLETCEHQRKLTETVLLLNRAAKEMIAINLRLAARLDAICGPMEDLGRSANVITDRTRAVTVELQESERRLRAVIAPLRAEPATLSLTDDAVAFSPEADERIARKILALEVEKPTFN